MGAFQATSWVVVILMTLFGGVAARGARAQTITEFPLPDPSPAAGIATGPDGALWFADSGIGRITTAGAISEFPGGNIFPLGIAAGPDGSMWFANFNGSIGRITTSGVITVFRVGLDRPREVPRCWGIAAGPDGNLWFTEREFPTFGLKGRIGRITTAGVITEFIVNNDPSVIVAGPDGALWFTETGVFSGSVQIGRITTAGEMNSFPVANHLNQGILDDGIATGPDGNLWFTEFNAIGRITTAGVITEFPISGNARAITAGPDGALWFTGTGLTDLSGGKIGRITTAGVVTEFPLPRADANARWITAGPDGALWFTESSYNKIGRITTSDLTPMPLPTPIGQHPRPVPFRKE